MFTMMTSAVAKANRELCFSKAVSSCSPGHMAQETKEEAMPGRRECHQEASRHVANTCLAFDGSLRFQFK